MAKKKVATKKEKEWMRKVSELDCYCCGSPAEVHHIRSLKTGSGIGLRPSHFNILPLCSVHHRTGKISVHLGKKAFEQKYGTEEQLKKKLRERLEEWRIITSIF